MDAAVTTVPQRSKTNAWGVVAIILGLVALVPQLVILGMAFVPDLSAAPWLFIITMPAGVLVGIIGIVSGVIGVVRARRTGTTRTLAVIGLVLSAACPVLAAVFFAVTSAGIY